MKQLSGMDNLFLALETGNQYMHVGGLGIYDATTAPGGSLRFKDILSFFSKRLNTAKAFRRRLVTTPMGLDRPHWIDEGKVDVEYHVRHIALPKPGDWRQLMIQVARLHARPLDRTRPLWEVYIIEGLDNIPGIPPSSFALYIKMHHAVIDGEAGAAIVGAIHSLNVTDDAAAKDAPTIVGERAPGPVELYSRAVGNRTKLAIDASKLLLSLGSRVAGAGRQLVTSGQALEMGKAMVVKRLSGKKAAAAETESKPKNEGLRLKPITRFDTRLSPHRVVDAIGFSLADCKKIRDHVDGVTINDIFMAASGGAIRKYLELKGELPDVSLNALMPMSTRGKNKDIDAGNQVGMAAMPLRTDVADPLERLLAVQRGSTRTKAASVSLGKDLPGKIINILPSVASVKLLKETLYKRANVTVSNVRGPDVPLYLAGARLQLFLPVSVVIDEMGLNITGFSYNGTFWVCVVSCREILPDPAVFAQCLNDSFKEILAAALAQQTVKAAPTPPANVKPAKPAKAAAKPAAKAKAAAPAKPKVATKRRTTA